MALGEVLVHAVEVAGPEVGLLAALGALDLDDHVAALVGVARQQQLLDLGFELGDPRFLLADLRLQVVAHLAVGLAAEQLPGVGEVGVGGIPGALRVDDRLELGVAAARVAGRAPVARRVDAGQVGFEPIELGGELTELFEHGGQGRQAQIPRPGPAGDESLEMEGRGS